MANLKYISSFIIFGQTRAIKWTVPSDFLAKKKQLSFYEGLQHTITKVDHCDNGAGTMHTLLS